MDLRNEVDDEGQSAGPGDLEGDAEGSLPDSDESGNTGADDESHAEDGLDPEGSEGDYDEQLEDDDGADTGLPDLPEGYDDWEQVIEAARQSQIQQQAAYQQQQIAYQQAVQAQAFQQQQQPNQDTMSWDRLAQLRTQRVREVQQLLERGADAETLAKLDPQDVADARAISRYTQQAWDKYFYNPGALIEEHAKPLVDEVQFLRQQVARLQAVQFRADNPELQSDENLDEYLGLVDRMQRDPRGTALQVLRMARSQSQAAREGQRRRTNEQDAKARARSARGGKKSKEERQRRGRPKSQLTKEQRSDPLAIGLEQLRLAKEAGEL